MIEDTMKKIIACIRIKIDEDYDNAKEGYNLQGDYMHIYVRTRQKGKLINQVHSNGDVVITTELKNFRVKPKNGNHHTQTTLEVESG